MPDGAPFIVWFTGSPDQQVQHLNRLRAEWPYALEEIEPTEPGDMWGACIARHQCMIGKAVADEFEVSDTRIVKLSKHWVAVLAEKLAR